MIPGNRIFVAVACGVILAGATCARHDRPPGDAVPTSSQPAPAPVSAVVVEERWGPVVNGVQARIVPEKRDVSPGEEVLLRIEMRNATDRVLSLSGPALFPFVAERGSHPYRSEDATKFNAVLTAEPLNDPPFMRWAEESYGEPEGLAWGPLGPGDRMSLDVVLASERPGGPLETPRVQGEPPRVRARFAYSRLPDTYRLVFRYSGAVGGELGQDPVVSEPVEIRVRAEQETGAAVAPQ